jgi:hypothetical protein
MSGNPSRGCGKKKEDSFYLEGSPPSGSGNVWAWTWCLGDGIENIAPLIFPPRQVTFVNPAACITTGDIVLADDDFKAAEWQYDLYARMCLAMKTIGIGDHVGKNHYSCTSFAKETNEYGISRRINKDTALVYAALIAKVGALPMLFTHSRVPVFTDINQRQQAIDIALNMWPGFKSDQMHMEATWQMTDWGMYNSPRRKQYNGNHSFMVPILNIVSALDNDWSLHKQDPVWQEAKEFYETLIYQEQPFGLSWVLQVTHTLPKDGQVDKSLLDVPGLRFLDLGQEEYVR